MRGEPKFKILRQILRIRVNNFGASGNNVTKLINVCNIQVLMVSVQLAPIKAIVNSPYLFDFCIIVFYFMYFIIVLVCVYIVIIGTYVIIVLVCVWYRCQ